MTHNLAGISKNQQMASEQNIVNKKIFSKFPHIYQTKT